MLELIEVRDEAGLKRIWKRISLFEWKLFYRERMTEERFLIIFQYGARLYEIPDIGIVTLWAVNPFCVKFGCLAYDGKVSRFVMTEILRILEDRIKDRGIRCFVAEVPASNMNVRRIAHLFGFKNCGLIENYYGNESMMVFSKTIGD